MSTATLYWLVATILFSAAVWEAFLGTVDTLKHKVAKVAAYQLAIVIWLFAPISTIDLASGWLSAFGEIDSVTWLVLWFSTSILHFLLRGRQMAESMWRAV